MAVTDRLHPDLVADAERVLAEGGYPCSRVIDVEPDCILYVNQMGKARTVWIERQEGTGRLRTFMVPGFQAEPPEAWTRPPLPRF